tara:strand:- start:439 stop:1143 length:705 start_codon:yes stop_codon:yes gene_type:complete
MKLLILSHPYNGACNFAAAVAADLGHNYFQLPLDNEVPKKQYLDGNEYDIPKGMAPQTHGLEGYNYPDEIPINTVVTHFVEWFKLPGNLNEDQFLDAFIPKFDKVLIIRSDDIEFNWKSHCAGLAKEHKNNYWWKKFNLEHAVHPYENDMMDLAIYNKHMNAHNFLVNFTNNNSYPNVTSEELYNNWDESSFGAMINSFDIGLNGLLKDGNNDHVYKTIWGEVTMCHLNQGWRW